MSFDLNSIKTDKDAEAKGVWTKKLFPGANFLIARAGNPAWLAEWNETIKPYTESGVEPPTEVKEKLVTDLTAKHILLGWEGVTIGDKELPYSPENAVMVLSTFKELLGRVVQFSQNFANYKEKVAKDIEGN